MMALSVKKKIFTSILGLLVTAGLTAFSATSEPHFCSDRLLESATFEDLQEKITRCQIESIDQLLPLLSEAHLSNYVLMHHSQSLQRSTPKAPRVILYGKDAKLIVAFTGLKHDPSDETHYNNLEIFQYRDVTHRFEARDIAFPETGHGPVQFSSANPPLCLSCHHDDPRPNWETYPLWPGAYGGEDDAVFRKGDAHKSKDSKLFIHFLAHEKKEGRYRFLSDLPAARLPNTEFGSLAQKLNLERIARKIAETPTLDQYRYALLGAVTCFYSDHFNRMEDYIPAQIQSTFKWNHADLDQSTKKMNTFDFVTRVQALREIFPKAPEDSRVREIFENISENNSDSGQVSDSLVASLRWVVENQGVATDDWGMQPDGASYDFENGYTGITDLRQILSEVLLVRPEDRALAQTLSQNDLTDLEGSCYQLQQRSLKTLGGIDIPIP